METVLWNLVFFYEDCWLGSIQYCCFILACCREYITQSSKMMKSTILMILVSVVMATSASPVSSREAEIDQGWANFIVSNHQTKPD